MANFIERTLEPGEKVIFKGRLHWSYNFRYTFWGILLILCAIAAVVMTTQDSENQTTWTIAAAAAAVIGLCMIFFGYFIRTKTEFAVTNTRFIQKDGILNIKMTEMPLARIETVNFYQTFFQRLLGTGCVEMVGSGGTSHQVHCIEEPMQVKKIICAAINKDRTDKSEQTVEQKAETNETNAK